MALAFALLALLLVPASATPHFGVIWTRSQPGATIDPGIDRSAAHANVIVQARDGQSAAAAKAVQAAGGTIGKALPIVNGFAAAIPGRAVDRLKDAGSIVAVTADRQAKLEQFSYDASTTSSNFTKSSGATAAWQAGYLGDGVGVAVLDSGVSPMNDLNGRIVYGPDLSGEGTTIDSYGHGTVMAGAIAGSGADSAGQAGGAYTGVAPHATIVAVKVAGRNGVTDVTTMLEAMHWVAAYQSQFNIRVVNLSWGVASTQDPSVDPVNYAVERLWRQGMVVAVAAGNNGPQPGILKPGDDPVALTVGAVDDKQNTNPADDSVPSWSSRGPTAAGLQKPDIVAPGRYITATRSFGSYIEQTYPKALNGLSYIRGSGTSEATAVAAGNIALLLQARPDLTPDQVKGLLMSTAAPIPTFTAPSMGAGRIQLNAALTAPAGPASTQTFASTGLGSIEASRGGIDVQAVCPGGTTPTPIHGEIDVRCEAWNGSAWTGSAWTGSAWTGSAWTGSAWTGSAWTGSAWTNATWTGSAWTGSAWTGSAWTGSAWTGSAWTGSAWTGSAWTGSAWTGSAWTDATWTGSAWTSAVYEDDTLFATAFWGNGPPWNKSLPGETSEPPPWTSSQGKAASAAGHNK